MRRGLLSPSRCPLAPFFFCRLPDPAALVLDALAQAKDSGGSPVANGAAADLAVAVVVRCRCPDEGYNMKQKPITAGAHSAMTSAFHHRLPLCLASRAPV